MQPIYIEISDEITTVIERMKASKDKKIALVVPKGAILLQSIVNLKLAKKAAADAKKELILVTTDTIGRNLASQVGIPLVTRLEGAEDAGVETDALTGDSEPHVIAGVKIHRYYENKDEEKSDEAGTTTPPIDPIIPREILTDKPKNSASAPEEEFSPIVVRPISTDSAPSKKSPIIEVITSRAKPSSSLVIPIVVENTLTKHTPSAQALRPRTGRRIVLAILFLLVLTTMVAGGVGAYYLPQTSVTIRLAPQPFSKDVSVTAKAGAVAGVADSIITVPAEYISAEESVTVPFVSTGSKDIGSVAKGTATLYNGYSGTPQTLPAGSQLKANGLIFITDVAVTVPGAVVQAGQPVAGSASVAVTAAASGSDSNLTNTTGSVLSPSNNLYCQIVSTVGGDSKKLPVVTQTDIANGKVELLKKMQDALAKKISDSMKGRTLLFTPNSSEFSLTTFTPSVPAGTEAAAGQVTGTATMRQLVLDKSTVDNAVRSYLLSLQDTTHTLTLTTITDKNLTAAGGVITLQSTGTGNLTSSVPLESIRAQLIGKNQDSGIKLIHLIVKDATTIEIKQTPDWWPNKNFPFSNKYLTVHLAHD